MAQSVDDVADQLRLVKQELAAAQQQNVVLKRATVQLEGKVGDRPKLPSQETLPPLPPPHPARVPPGISPSLQQQPRRLCIPVTTSNQSIVLGWGVCLPGNRSGVQRCT